jgi:protein-S-isoprenylcysteine O-methyltransferase Ste14
MTDDPPADPSAATAAAGIMGAVLAGAGISLMLWAVVSFPAVSPGHYILPEHRLIDEGAYAIVRHPLYLAALLIWAGIAAGFQSLAVLVVLLAYVLPAYLIYVRAEERMMSSHFGPAYERYCERVPGLIPRWTPPARGDSTARG